MNTGTQNKFTPPPESGRFSLSFPLSQLRITTFNALRRSTNQCRSRRELFPRVAEVGVEIQQMLILLCSPRFESQTRVEVVFPSRSALDDISSKVHGLRRQLPCALGLMVVCGHYLAQSVILLFRPLSPLHHFYFGPHIVTPPLGTHFAFARPDMLCYQTPVGDAV